MRRKVDAKRQFQVGTALFIAVALAHALVTWPLRSTVVLFAGGIVLAFVGEVLVIRLGLLRHHVGPKVAGVPLLVLPAWPATVYVFFRLVTLVFEPGVVAAAVAALAATAADIVQDPIGVRRGLWTYPDASLSRPRFESVPWWNFVGWFVLVFVTAMLVVWLG